MDYRVVFESAPVGLEYYDKDGILIDINENAMRIYGCSDKKHLLESRICLYDVEKGIFYSILGEALAGEGFSLEENLSRLHPDDHRMQTELLAAIVRERKRRG